MKNLNLYNLLDGVSGGVGRAVGLSVKSRVSLVIKEGGFSVGVSTVFPGHNKN